MIHLAKYMNGYFKGCKLIGKKRWLHPGKDKASTARKASISKADRVRLSARGTNSVNTNKMLSDVYVFLLPKIERDDEGRRRYGALYPDGAPMIWPYEWAKSPTVDRELEEDDHKLCAERQQRLLKKERTRLTSRSVGTKAKIKRRRRVKLIKEA